MKVDVTTVGSFQKQLQITVPAQRVKGELDQAFRRLSRQVRLPGFRPGKAPRRILEARFGAQVKSEVANDLIQATYTSAVVDEGLEPVGRPSLAETGDLIGGQDFVFTVTVDVRPHITLEKYTGVDVVYPKVEVSDDEVAVAVRARLEGQARLVAVEGRGVQAGDMALVELVAKDGDDELAREQGTMIRTAGDPYYPGIEDFLSGMAVGEQKSGEITFGDDARTEAVAGRTLAVDVTVHSIQASEVPELDDAIAEELGYDGGADGMRAAVRAQMQEQRDALARNQARANLLESLIEANSFDVPDGMIDESLNMLMEELKAQESYRSGRDPRTISFSDAQVADLRVRASFASKAGLILEYVSETEDIVVTDADLDGKYQELADSRGQTVEAVKGWFSSDEAVSELKDRLLEEKTLEWLLERAVLVDPPEPTEAPEEAAAEPEPAAEATPEPAARAAPEPAAEAAPEPAAEPSAGADLSVLGGAIGKLKKALATGEHDAHIDELIAAEEAGKARKGALEALRSRQS